MAANLSDELQALLKQQKETIKTGKESASIHYEITRILEKRGNELGNYKYYYRSYTYNLIGDYLIEIGLPEIAIDACFRALIFQGNFEKRDGGKLMFETISSIMRCYWMVNDGSLLKMIFKDFEGKISDCDSVYQRGFCVLKKCMSSKFQELENAGEVNIEYDDELRELISSSWFGNINLNL